jgi:hypothetical protein
MKKEVWEGVVPLSALGFPFLNRGWEGGSPLPAFGFLFFMAITHAPFCLLSSVHTEQRYVKLGTCKH